MRKLKYSISRNALNQMYMSFLLPVVEYASVVWHGCSEQDSQTLQKIQNEAARLVTGLTRSVSLEVVMVGTLAQIFFKPEKNLEFFRLKICARDAYPGKLE